MAKLGDVSKNDKGQEIVLVKCHCDGNPDCDFCTGDGKRWKLVSEYNHGQEKA